MVTPDSLISPAIIPFVAKYARICPHSVSLECVWKLFETLTAFSRHSQNGLDISQDNLDKAAG